MNTGMLWLKSHEKPQLDAILEASAYYERKYGVRPDVAFVNPAELPERAPDGIKVEPMKEVLKKYLWIGKE